MSEQFSLFGSPAPSPAQPALKLVRPPETPSERDPEPVLVLPMNEVDTVRACAASVLWRAGEKGIKSDDLHALTEERRQGKVEPKMLMNATIGMKRDCVMVESDGQAWHWFHAPREVIAKVLK